MVLPKSHQPPLPHKKWTVPKVKYLLPICQILRNFTEGNAKIHCQFCFLCSCWRQKISKRTNVFLRARANYLSFRPQRAWDRKTIGSHLKLFLDIVPGSSADVSPALRGCFRGGSDGRKCTQTLAAQVAKSSFCFVNNGREMNKEL